MKLKVSPESAVSQLSGGKIKTDLSQKMDFWQIFMCHQVKKLLRTVKYTVKNKIMKI